MCVTRGFSILVAAVAFLGAGVAPRASCEVGAGDSTHTVSSPDEQTVVTFLLKEGVPYYRVSHAGRTVIRNSRLGLVFRRAGCLDHDLMVEDFGVSEFDDTWVQPWGEVRQIRDHHRELRVRLAESAPPNRRMEVVFRVFDDGVGSRYELPEQPGLSTFEIMDERTEFSLSGSPDAWWIPAYMDNRYEYLYAKSPVNDLRAVHTPLTMETQDGLFLSIHEAALTDYASMTLVRTGEDVLECDLVPWADGVKVRGATPMVTPWRTIQIAESAGDLITSYLILNLNEPNRLGDVSWITPGKYVGIWWGMHIGKYTWGSGPRHGATTENAMRYVDFAAAHRFLGVLIEGWNTGWDGNWIQNGEIFDFTTAYPDFDIEEVSRYARDRDVQIIGHHETGAAIHNYEPQMVAAFEFFGRLGIRTVKTGYVGTRVNRTEWHHGQYMVEHYRKAVEEAARHRIMLDVHEPIKDTGIRRTYPNMMTREGARGMEYDAWSPDGGNPPEHTTVLPFTRMLAGPFDMTPGIFDLFFEEYRPKNRVNTTLAKQLAYYVVIYSPLQMAADLPENYEGHPGFQFIVDVPTDWEETRVLHAKIGDYVTMARRDRRSDDWYIGSITDEEGRTLEARLDFLDAGRAYVAEVYADGPGAHWETNPLAISVREVSVDRTSVLKIELAPGGGQAIRIRPASRGWDAGEGSEQ